METTTKRRGRPAGRDYPVVKQVRLTPKHAEELAFLGEVWQCSEAETFRRVIHELAELVKSRQRRESRPEMTEAELEEGYRWLGTPEAMAPWPEEDLPARLKTPRDAA